MLLQALCIISKPWVNSNWSHSPETPNLCLLTHICVIRPQWIKLYALFQSHVWIQTGVTVRKHPIWAKIDDFLSRVTVKFGEWPRKTKYTHKQQYSKTWDSKCLVPVAKMVEHSAWIRKLGFKSPLDRDNFCLKSFRNFLENTVDISNVKSNFTNTNNMYIYMCVWISTYLKQLNRRRICTYHYVIDTSLDMVLVVKSFRL